MKVKDLIRYLRKQKAELPVKMFAHDHEPKDHRQGDGEVRTVDEVTDDKGQTFVCLHA